MEKCRRIEVVDRFWKVQQWDGKTKTWFNIGSDCSSLGSVKFYLEKCIRPKDKRRKLRIVEYLNVRKVIME